MLRNTYENRALRARIAELEKDFHEKTFRLRESQIKYKNIVNNSTDAIVVIQKSHIKFVNKRFEILTGYLRDDIVNTHFSDLLHPEDCAQAVAEGNAGKMTDEYLLNTGKFRIRRKDASFLWVDNRMVESTWEDMPSRLCFLGDISERKTHGRDDGSV